MSQNIRLSYKNIAKVDLMKDTANTLKVSLTKKLG